MGTSAILHDPGWTCAKEVNNPEYAGLSTSVINTGGMIGAATVPVIVGRVMDMYVNSLNLQLLFSRAFTVSLISALIGYIFYFL